LITSLNVVCQLIALRCEVKAAKLTVTMSLSSSRLYMMGATLDRALLLCFGLLVGFTYSRGQHSKASSSWR
jgi:hypothetical protein